MIIEDLIPLGVFALASFTAIVIIDRIALCVERVCKK